MRTASTDDAPSTKFYREPAVAGANARIQSMIAVGLKSPPTA